MYAWYICRDAVGAEMEAELLIELLTVLIAALQGGPDAFNNVRGLDCRCSICLDKAILDFRCKGRDVLLSTEGALRVSIDCYDIAGSGHLEFEVGIVRDALKRANAVRPSSA